MSVPSVRGLSSSTTEAANEDRIHDEGFSYVV